MNLITSAKLFSQRNRQYQRTAVLMALMEENLGETYKASQETTVHHCDDEGSWVQLKPFNDVAVIEMIRCAREVTDFKRIKVDGC